MKILSGYKVNVNVVALATGGFHLLVETSGGANHRGIQQWEIPFSDRFEFRESADRMAEYVLMMIDRVSIDGKPNFRH